MTFLVPFVLTLWLGWTLAFIPQARACLLAPVLIRGRSARYGKLALELLDQPGWTRSYEWEHVTGVSLRRGFDGLATMKVPEQSVSLNDYWAWKVGRKLKKLERDDDVRKHDAADQKLGQNIIDFAEKVRAIR